MAMSRVMTRARGFTLPEVLIVIVVVGVLIGAGVPSFGEFLRNQRVKTASFELFSSLVVARSEAITRNLTVTMAPIGGAWTNGWTIADSGGVVIRTQDPVPSIAIAGPVSVVYGGSGRLTAATAPQFQLTAAGSSVVSRCIRIDLSGRPVSKAAAC